MYLCPNKVVLVNISDVDEVSFLRTEQLITKFLEKEDTFKKTNQRCIMRCTSTVRSTEVI